MVEQVEATKQDRLAAWPYRPSCYKGNGTYTKWMNGLYDTSAPVIKAFAAHRIAGMEAAFAMIPEMGRKIEKERLWEARSWGGPTMYTPLNLEELITAIRAALNGGQHE